MQLHIATTQKRQIIDITDQVAQKLDGDGLVNVFVKHTTAAITTADLDPGTDEDYLRSLDAMTPNAHWQHPHDPSHFPDHFWSTVIGTSLSIPFTDGRLDLGSWQRIILVELDGPRERIIRLTIINT